MNKECFFVAYDGHWENVKKQKNGHTAKKSFLNFWTRSIFSRQHHTRNISGIFRKMVLKAR